MKIRSWVTAQATQKEPETQEAVWSQTFGSKIQSVSTQQRQFHVNRFILTQALLLLIHTLKPCRHHRLMHAGKMSKHYRSTNKKKKKENDVCAHCLCLNHRTGMYVALEDRGKICRAKGEVVCGNTLYTLYTVVAAVGGAGGSHHGL